MANLSVLLLLTVQSPKTGALCVYYCRTYYKAVAGLPRSRAVFSSQLHYRNGQLHTALYSDSTIFLSLFFFSAKQIQNYIMPFENSGAPPPVARLQGLRKVMWGLGLAGKKKNSHYSSHYLGLRLAERDGKRVWGFEGLRVWGFLIDTSKAI